MQERPKRVLCLHRKRKPEGVGRGAPCMARPPMLRCRHHLLGFWHTYWRAPLQPQVQAKDRAQGLWINRARMSVCPDDGAACLFHVGPVGVGHAPAHGPAWLLRHERSLGRPGEARMDQRCLSARRRRALAGSHGGMHQRESAQTPAMPRRACAGRVGQTQIHEQQVGLAELRTRPALPIRTILPPIARMTRFARHRAVEP